MKSCILLNANIINLNSYFCYNLIFLENEISNINFHIYIYIYIYIYYKTFMYVLSCV